MAILGITLMILPFAIIVAFQDREYNDSNGWIALIKYTLKWTLIFLAMVLVIVAGGWMLYGMPTS